MTIKVQHDPVPEHISKEFSEVLQGDFFARNGTLYQKVDADSAHNIMADKRESFYKDFLVDEVDVDIKWRHRR